MQKHIVKSSPRLLPMRLVEERCGLSRSSIYRLIANGKFPQAIRLDLGNRSRQPSRWLASEIDQWIAFQVESARS